MTEKFNNKYRIPSARLQCWDYGADGIYFVTICTVGHEHYFGDIDDGVMKLNALGEIAYQRWMDITKHFPHVILDAHVVMPNHMHGIVIIDNNLDKPDNDRKWKSGVLGVIINQYKRAVTLEARKVNRDFAWQPRFHEHIVRNDQAFQTIEEYIQDNPLRWVDDMFYRA